MGNEYTPRGKNRYTCHEACAVCGYNIPEDGTCHGRVLGSLYGQYRPVELYHAECCPLPHPHPGSPADLRARGLR